MGREHASREKKLPMVNFLIFVHENVYRIRFQKIKIGPLKGFEKKAFFSLLLMRKRLSGGQKWFLKPYFPLIRGMFVFRSGLRFSFRTLEVPELRVRKRSLWCSGCISQDTYLHLLYCSYGVCMFFSSYSLERW